MTTLNLQVGESADDATEASSGLVDNDQNYTGGRILMGDFIGWCHGGYRFQGVSGLNGATINSVILSFRAKDSDTGSFIGDFYAQDAEAPGAFVESDYDITSRDRTTATVEADSSDFGNWTLGNWYSYPTDGTIDIKTIIQELADNYNPSEIVILFIYTSGTGERAAVSYDYDSALAAKLDIDYEAAGGVEVTPTAHNFAWEIPTPTFSPQTATFTPSALAYGWNIPSPSVVAGVQITPTVLVYGWAIPTPTLTLEFLPSALAYGWAIPTPSVVAGVSVTPTVLAYGWAIPTPAFSPQTATFTPSAVAYGWSIPSPAVGVGEVIYSIWYEVTHTIDTNDYPSTAQYYLEVVLQTSAAAAPAYARLWNITNDVEVVGSEISTASETAALVRSAAITMPSGSKSYRVEYGGEPGSVITMYTAAVVVETD
jgi:hypothetical protein